MLEEARRTPAEFEPLCRSLFGAMQGGGRLGFERVEWFNGGLFDDDSTLPLTRPHIEQALDAAAMDWSQIDPSVMGTLFERGLDPDKRSQLGAHYTDAEKIMKIIEPVIQRPLAAEWAEARAGIEALLAKGAQSAAPGVRTKARNDAAKLYKGFLDRLRSFRVLDPACGSGNFLYLALQTLKDLEHRAGIEAEALGLLREFPQVGPEQLLGIEINPYAAELARVSVWIGEIQWMQRNGFGIARNPILRPLDTIECRDAILSPDGTEADWPATDAIIGNPPFLGGKMMRTGLDDAYVDRLFAAYTARVPREADLVCYWFAKSAHQLRAQRAGRSGLVATNSIRGGANRRVLDEIRQACVIFEAWDDEPWVIEGAAVRVSLVCFAPAGDPVARVFRLDGEPVAEIYSDLTARHGTIGIDLTKAARLPENVGVAFMGDTKGGAFDVPGELAREWLRAPINPNGRRNSDVLLPWVNGLDVTRRLRDMWIIDFGWTMTEADGSLYEAPFSYAEEHVQRVRVARQQRGYARHWWRHERPRPEMWAALSGVARYIATPTVAKHRLFVWLDRAVCPDHQLIVVARDDDATFGILHSRLHELWALRLGTWLGVGNDPRYTPSTTFEMFPFPNGLTPDTSAEDVDEPRAQRIAAAARRLNELRENWLNPPDLVVRVPEVVPGFPDRILPRDEEAASQGRPRTTSQRRPRQVACRARAGSGRRLGGAEGETQRTDAAAGAPMLGCAA
ncbi:MAG: class I SAM-dependent DNA methyltransferase, partial [Kiloniellales bacterium]